MSRKYPREGDCKRIGPRLERVADQLILYAERKRFLAPIMQELRERVPDPSKYPEEWASMVLAMIGAAAVTTVPKRTQGFVRSVQNLLAPEDLQLARQWRRVPWAFIAFETVEPVEHDIVLVEPIGAAPAGWPGDLPWERLPVYSPSLANAHSRGSRSGLALIAYDGALFHTYGVILNFASFSTDDLLYFASIAADDTTADELPFLLGAREDVPSISEVIRNDPLSFLLLFQWQGIPTVTGRAGAWRYCASMITYDGGEDLADEEVWRRVIAEAGHVIQDIVVTDEIVGIRLGEEGPMYEPLILVSLEDRAVYVRAMNDDAYARSVAAVAPLITIPSEPQVQASMAMMQAAEAILEPVDLLSDLEAFVSETFDGAGDLGGPAAESDGDLLEEDQKPPEIAVIQPVLDLLMEDFNEGRNYTDEMIAEKTGAEVEQVRMLREQVQAMMDRAPGGGAGGGRGGGAGNAPGGATRPAAERIKPADRFGLAPGPFHRIISSPVPAEKGVLALRDLREAVLTPGEHEALGSVALFRFARWMVGLEQIPATAAGYVAPSIVRRAIEEEIVPIYHDVFQMDLFNDAMPKKEIDAPVFNRYREVLEAAGLIRLDGKRFVVPARMRSADLGTIVSTITEAMFTSARWDTSRYGKPLPRLRESAGFLLYVVKRLSANERDGWVPVRAVYDAFLGAHPQLADQISPGDIQNPGSAGWWVFFNIRVHFVDLFGETLGVLEGNYPGAEGPSRATLPDLDSYLVRPSRRFSILFR
ncbi:MAG: hypothetical protein ACLFP6_00370 [Spirochaetaceae bacterium]